MGHYTEVLRDIAVGEPVFLTKNGRGRYVIVDIEEYEKTSSTLRLMSELAKGEQSAKEIGWIDLTEVESVPLFSSIINMETDHRFLVCGKYTVFYRIEGQTVNIVRVLYGRRNFMRILFGEPSDN